MNPLNWVMKRCLEGPMYFLTNIDIYLCERKDVDGKNYNVQMALLLKMDV